MKLPSPMGRMLLFRSAMNHTDFSRTTKGPRDAARRETMALIGLRRRGLVTATRIEPCHWCYRLTPKGKEVTDREPFLREVTS